MLQHYNISITIDHNGKSHFTGTFQTTDGSSSSLGATPPVKKKMKKVRKLRIIDQFSKYTHTIPWSPYEDHFKTQFKNSWFLTLSMHTLHEEYPLKEYEDKYFHTLLFKTLDQGPRLERVIVVKEFAEKSQKLHYHLIVWLKRPRTLDLFNYYEGLNKRIRQYNTLWPLWTTKKQYRHYAINHRPIKSQPEMEKCIKYMKKDSPNTTHPYYYNVWPKNFLDKDDISSEELQLNDKYDIQKCNK